MPRRNPADESGLRDASHDKGEEHRLSRRPFDPSEFSSSQLRMYRVQGIEF